jgi:membrane-anchored mycosin MYCP
MRGGGMLFAIFAGLAAGGTGVVSPTPAFAASCSTPPAPAQPSPDKPWAQVRLATDRLSSIGEGLGVVVAVIDSGVDARHPQLRGRVLSGRDFLDPAPGNDGRIDCVGHGTAVASIIAATRADGSGLRGLAPGVKILPVRVSEQQVIDGETTGRTVGPARFAAAIRWAVDNGADVLNFSVVLRADVPAVRDAVEYAVARDVVVVAAAGNQHEQNDPRPYPAAYPGVIGVGAIGRDDLRQPFSQVGSYVDVMAPGAGITVASTGRGHIVRDGTSYAVPFVSATAAIIRGMHPEMSAWQVRRRITATADPSAGGPGSESYGSGVVNPYRAAVDLISLAGPSTPAAPRAARPAPISAAAHSERTRERSVLLALGSTAAAGLALACSTVLARGARRRWRPADRRS